MKNEKKSGKNSSFVDILTNFVAFFSMQEESCEKSGQK